MVSETLRRERLYKKLSKYEFWLESISFFRHIISENGISVDPNKVAAVRDWHVSKLVIKVRRFLGLADNTKGFCKTSKNCRNFDQTNVARQEV